MLLIQSPDLSPPEDLALDELLLERAVAGELGTCLRLWSAERYFVVMGRHGKAEAECHVARCRRERIPILQRASGGGTVLQGPNCLNFSFILDTRADPRLEDVKESYRVILGRIAGAFRERDLAIRLECCSDLALDGLKISGNAQLRRRHWLLHHGTLLCGFDLRRVSRYLKHPPREPAYRQGRAHAAFITNLPLTAGETSVLLCEALGPFSGTWAPEPQDLERLGELAAQVQGRVSMGDRAE